MPYPKFNLIKYPVLKQVYFLKKTNLNVFFQYFFNFDICSGTDYGCPMKPFFIKIPNFWAWADEFCSMYVVAPSLVLTLFLQKAKPLCPNPKYLFWIGI